MDRTSSINQKFSLSKFNWAEIIISIDETETDGDLHDK